MHESHGEARFFDLQVNGYAGVDFNSDCLSGEDLKAACQQLIDDGVRGILATVITDDIEAMCRRLARIVSLREQDSEIKAVIAGIHIEGPFISRKPGYVGAHPLDAVLPADIATAERMLNAAGGLTRILTLAPECDPDSRLISHLSKQGIVVAGGHSDADLPHLRTAIDAGLSLFTHLGNACPMNMHRHDNIVQRVLSLCDQICISFIADGAHIPYPALGNYLRCAGIERCCVVTDAISAAGLGPGTYPLGEQQIVIGDDLVPWAEDRSHFVGSATIMPRAAENLRSELRLTPEAITRLTWQNPRQILGLTE